MADQEEVKDNIDSQGGEGGNKDHKKFENVVDQIQAVINGDNSIFKNKVPNDQIGQVVGKLAEKRRQGAVDKFSVDFDQLLDSYITFQNECKQKRQEMEKAILEKEKEFTKKANACLGQLENIGAYLGQYKAALKRATDENNPAV